MRKLIKTVGYIVLLGSSLALASTSSVDNPTTVKGYGGNHCDPIEHLMGICKSSQTLLSEN